jgi:hypothetical protein
MQLDPNERSKDHGFVILKRSEESLYLNHHGCLGPHAIMKLLVGAVREPPLRVNFHGKAAEIRNEAALRSDMKIHMFVDCNCV